MFLEKKRTPATFFANRFLTQYKIGLKLKGKESKLNGSRHESTIESNLSGSSIENWQRLPFVLLLKSVTWFLLLPKQQDQELLQLPDFLLSASKGLQSKSRLMMKSEFDTIYFFFTVYKKRWIQCNPDWTGNNNPSGRLSWRISGLSSSLIN